MNSALLDAAGNRRERRSSLPLAIRQYSSSNFWRLKPTLSAKSLMLGKTNDLWPSSPSGNNSGLAIGGSGDVKVDLV
jgi:hypothetical protein